MNTIKTLQDLQHLSKNESHVLKFWTYEFSVPKEIRKFKDSDYEALKQMMNEYLSKYYDWHSDNSPLLNQLINKEDKDNEWFFTKNKFVLVYQDDAWNPIWLIAINNKRWPSIKTWPLLVHHAHQGQWIWKTLKLVSEKICRDLWAHKMYATTSFSNTAALSLNKILWYKQEAYYKDQYKKWSDEVILWKILTPEREICREYQNDIQTTLLSVYNNCPLHWKLKIRRATQEDKSFMENTRLIYEQRHDDLNYDFIENMINAQERGMNFQSKWKQVLVVEDESWIQWMWTLTPKRWWPCKLYPIQWSGEAQKNIIASSESTCKEIWGTKLYTFVQEYDTDELQFLLDQWFSIAENKEEWISGKIQSPYKIGYNIIALEKMV